MARRPATLGALLLTWIVIADASTIEEIVVTGTRLPVPASDATSSITLLEPADLQRDGVAPLGEILQQLPASTGSPANSGFNASGEAQGGSGAMRVDLRGLGPERTLVLLDGRRLVSSPGSTDAAVDLGMIPLGLVDRVEVLGAGTAAVYGTDAIGGVVNLISRDPTDGTSANAALSQTTRGDGSAVRIDLTSGFVNERSRLQGGVECYQQGAVWMRDREYSRQREALDEDGNPVALGLAQTPQGYFRVPAGNRLGLPSGIYTRVEDSSGPGTAQSFRPFDEPGDRYNPNEDEYLRTPVEYTTFWLQGGGDIAQATEWSFDALLHQRDSSQQLRPAPVDVRFGIGIPRLPNGRPGIPAANYYNPFGTNMLDVRRRVVEAGRREFEQDVTMGRALASAHGRAHGFEWEAAAGWSRADVTQVTTGEIRSDRLQLALGPSGLDALGRVVCGQPDPATGRVPLANVIPDCVPLNLFGGQGADGRGTIDQHQLNYVTDKFVDRGSSEQWLADFTTWGSAGRLWGGEVRWAAGLEYRRELTDEAPDPDKLAGVTGTASPSNLMLNGEFDVTELFGELRLPLAADARWARLLALDVGARWSRFTSFGTTTNGSAALLWKPADAVALRASYADVFRAPPLPSLYAPTVSFFSNARDPCGNEPTSQQAANCAAHGVPGGSYVQAPLDEVPNTRGGNPDLRPEHGHTWSVGTTLTPGPRDISLTVEYWDIDIAAAIRQLRDQTILDDCADSGAVAVCRLISRADDGSVTGVDARYLNIGAETARGVDLDARYSQDWALGRTTVRGLATWLAERSVQTSAHASAIEVAGGKFERGLYPRWRGLAGIDHANGPWVVSYSLQYIGPTTECSPAPPLLPGLMTGCREIDDVLYHDLIVRRRIGRRFWMELDGTNLTDEDPPRVAFGFGEGNTSTLTYRLLGRTIGLAVGVGMR